MRKRNSHHEDHVDESWLIPYADMLTLLLALFIVLFAASTIDAEKFQKIASSFNSALNGGEGPLDYNEPITLNDIPPKETIIVPKEPTASPSSEEIDRVKLKELQEKIDTYISNKKLSLSLKTNLTESGLIITILDDALFDSGSAEIKPNANKLAIEISQFLVAEPPRQIIIAGHTDNVPIKNSNYDSNWVLSFFRAYNFMEVLLKNPDLEPDMLSPIANGEYQPVASNKTEAGRAKNRRVEIKILPYEGDQ
jgi:chemotaxis protein MotB